MEAIRVDSLTVKYGNFCAVDNISFTVSEREIFGIVGPNGAGKTSTVECIEGLRRAHSGKVGVVGLDPGKERKELYGAIGVQLQDTAYQDRVRVWEICDLFTSLYRNPAPYDDLLQTMGLADKRKTFVARLSGGQRQKLSIVLALIPNPRVVFFDELTTGLDPHARHRMWDLLLQLRERGLTIVLVSHYMDEVEAVCDRVAIMDRGRLLSVGPVDEVVNGFGLQTEISFCSSMLHTAGIERLAGVASVKRSGNRVTVYGSGDDCAAVVLQYLRDEGIAYRGLSVKPPNLENVFLKLVGYALPEDSRQAAVQGRS